MKGSKRRKLESQGWKFGTTKDFLQLTPEESEYIEIKLKQKDNRRTPVRMGSVVQM